MEYYLNNAGASIVSEETLSAIEQHLALESKIGGYQAAEARRVEVSGFYSFAAGLLKAQSADSIAFTDSASRAWNLALYGMPIQRGDTIVTLSSEFGTNLVSLFHFASKAGAQVRVIACDTAGRFDLNEIRLELEEGARLIAVSHAAAHGSIVNPVEEIGRLAATYNALYLVDGCQSAGQMEVDVQAIGCHAYTCTGRKWLRGPRGTGFLYVKPGSPISSLYVDLASADLTFSADGTPNGVEVRQDARRFELWERSIANVLGLKNALVEYDSLDREQAWSRMRSASRSIRECVADRADLQLLGEIESASSIAGFYLLDPSKEDVVRDNFKSSKVAVSTMSDWDCPLHFPRNGAKSVFRLAPHYYTSDETIAAAIKTIRELP